jgi:hypothetical protein
MSMSRTRTIAASRFWAVALIGLSVACGEESTGTPAPSLLAGLSQSTARDSAGTTIPNAGTEGPGSVRGTVMGPSNGSGGDTLSTSPRVVGARIAAFAVTGGTQANPTLGPEVTSATTGADGKFTTATIPGGEYVFTVTPPAGSPYQGVWVTTRINTGSNTYPWWIVLPKK